MDASQHRGGAPTGDGRGPSVTAAPVVSGVTGGYTKGGPGVHILVSSPRREGRYVGRHPSQESLGRGLGRVDPFDVRLEDIELLDEVELTANLIVAANQSESHMSADEIDQILGVIPQPRSGD